MRKISRTRSRSQRGAPVWPDQAGSPPPGIQGATVTSKPVDFDLDLSNLLIRSVAPATITGAETAAGCSGSLTNAGREAKEIVSLSDGTLITFVTAD
jgi:hypothetical protein